MSAEQQDAPRRAGALGFYFNADDTPRAGSPTEARFSDLAWEPRWIEGELHGRAAVLRAHR